MHVAPELVAARRSLTAPYPSSMAGDVYAFGCVIYQIVYRLPLVSDDWLAEHASSSHMPVNMHTPILR
jgi:hypothetical protein